MQYIPRINYIASDTLLNASALFINEEVTCNMMNKYQIGSNIIMNNAWIYGCICADIAVSSDHS